MARVSLLITLLVMTAAATPASAKVRFARGNRVGVLFGYQSPAPATLGTSVGVYLFDFLRLEGGFGVGGEIPGSALSTFATAMATTTFYVVTAGLIKWQDIYRFLKNEDPPTNFLTTLGGGIRIFLPGAPLVPSAGIHYAAGSVTGTVLGLSGDFRHVYYSLGLDWQSRIGLNIGAGLNYSPSLPEAARYLAFVNVGWFF